MDNLCIVCGAVIPEGRQVCPNCEKEYGYDDSLVVDNSHFLRGSICRNSTDGTSVCKQRVKGK